MIFTKTTLADAWLLDLEQRGDERGFFARTFCEQEFAAHGMVTRYAQMNTNFSARRGTLRGVHWQDAPHGEAKLVRCISGAAYDLIVDMRPESPTYRQWEAFELTPANRRLLYVPPGFGHSFLALEDETEITYFASVPYAPGAERGVRWNDPGLGFKWAIEPTIVSEKDAAWPDYADPQ
jgi:dTDP-4-dehydrorhamnose 3,5-epimerase